MYLKTIFYEFSYQFITLQALHLVEKYLAYQSSGSRKQIKWKGERRVFYEYFYYWDKEADHKYVGFSWETKVAEALHDGGSCKCERVPERFALCLIESLVNSIGATSKPHDPWICNKQSSFPFRPPCLRSFDYCYTCPLLPFNSWPSLVTD